MLVHENKIVRMNENEVEDARELGFSNREIMDYFLYEEGLSASKVKSIIFNNKNNTKKETIHRYMNENKLMNSYNEEETKSPIEEIKLQDEDSVKELLSDLDKTEENLNSIKILSVDDKLNLLFKLKVQQLSLEFSHKKLTGSFETEEKLFNEIKNLIPNMKTKANNILNRIINLKLKNGKAQDKLIISKIKESIIKEIESNNDVDMIPFILRNCYLTFYKELGLPQLTKEQSKEISNKFVEILTNYMVSAEGVIQPISCSTINKRIVPVVKYFDSEVCDFDDIMEMLFKNTTTKENKAKFKSAKTAITDILFDMTGDYVFKR